jgi:hypothetical protein
MIDRKMQAKKVWIDTSTGSQYSFKANKNCEKFDSKGEYQVWKMLNRVLPKQDFLLKRQSRVELPEFSWCIDFKVESLNDKASSALSEICCLCNYVYLFDVSEIWIEFKGRFDKNYDTKQTYLACSEQPYVQHINERTVVCSNESACWIHQDSLQLRTYTKISHSKAYLEKVIKSCLKQ